MLDYTSRAALVLITSAAIAACSSENAEQTREPAVRPVKMITLSTASGIQTSQYPAVISARQFSELSFQVGGLIKELVVVESQQVEEGDMIARIDQRDFQNKLVTARSQFHNAEDEYQRAVRLAKEDAIARSVLEQRKSQRDVAKAHLDSAEKALQDTIIRAPFAGAIVRIPVRERENVPAGQVVAALMGHGELEVTVNVPASVIAEARLMGNSSAVVILDASPNNRIEASFAEADLLADSASQTYGVTFTFDPPERLIILPGMNATVELSSTRRTEAAATSRISVPLSAIVSDGPSRYVWVVEKDLMTVSRREVSVADGIGDIAVVTEGLALGDTIATAGASFLADGMQVRPWVE